MNVKTTRYICQNCETKFELPEHQNPRCPNCYWTTSIRKADQVRSASPAASVAPKKKLNLQLGKMIRPVATMVFAGILIWTGRMLLGKIHLSQTTKKKVSISKPAENAAQQKNAASAPISTDFLSAEERAELNKWVPFDIPRTIASDELGMLSRKTEFSIPTNEIPQLKFWTRDTFDDALAAVQRKRKIHFTGSYEGQLKKLFKNHYLVAEQKLKTGDFVSARTELLNALLFPVYHNDIRLHRAVALVMMHDYINEVMGKIQVLNAYTVTQNLSAEINSLEKDYAELFSLIEAKKWDEALASVTRMETSAKSIEEKTKQVHVDYPPVISQIDQDIQKSLNFQDQTITPFTSGLTSLLADLRIKRRVLEQNTTEALKPMKEKYDLAQTLVQNKKWQDAKDALEAISFPPEIAEDAKNKVLIVSKIVDRAVAEPAKEAPKK